MKYWKITIETKRKDLEGVIGALLNEGFASYEVQDPADVTEVLRKEHDYDYDVADESLLAVDPAGDPKIVLYLEDEPEGDLKEAEQLRALERAVFAFDDVSFEKELVDDSLWKNSFTDAWTTRGVRPMLFSIRRLFSSISSVGPPPPSPYP